MSPANRRTNTPNRSLHLTGAARLVSRGMKVLQAAPAGERGRSAKTESNCMLGWFRKSAGSARFWDWLAANTQRIQSQLRQDPQGIGAEISTAFKRDYPELAWEVTPSESPPWLFCISADGNHDLFPSVLRAVRAAPAIPAWKVQPFRPRGSVDGELQFGDRKLGVDDIWCSAEPSGNGIDLTLWIRGLTPQTDQILSRAVLILLDNAIGEYDAVMKVKQLGRGPLPADPERTEGLFPLRELPALLDRLPNPEL